ncbi:MAG: cardiolipin synthase [Verrucomicrobiota bacterium]|jgi:cardiolipin synthase
MNQLGLHLLLVAWVFASGFGCSALPAEKRIRHSIRPDYSVNEPEFRNSISQLLGSPLVESNSVVEMLNGDRVFDAMLEAIRGAQSSITIEQFIWSSGKIGTRFVEALSERARAGVKVKIVVDSLGSLKLHRSDVSRMKKAGVVLERFNPPIVFRLTLPFKLLGINRRTHRKLMVVDGRVGFIGGVCLSDKWAGNAEPGQWRDTHFRVEGPVVGQMQGIFAGHWLKARSEVLHGPAYFPELKPAGNMVAQSFASGPKEGAEKARLAYLLSIGAARKNIRLSHAYFVPCKSAIDALVRARERGVKVELIIPGKSDNFAVRSAGRSRWSRLVKAGVEFYEYEPTLYHCKIMIVDDIWSTVGSINFDEKSFRHNDEANLNILDRNFAAALTQIFEDDKSKSRHITIEEFKNRSLLTRFMDFVVGKFHSEL